MTCVPEAARRGTGQLLEVPITAAHQGTPQPLLLTAASSPGEEGMSPPPLPSCSATRAPPADGLAPFATLELPQALAPGLAGGKEDRCVQRGSRRWKEMFLQGRVFGPGDLP